METRGVIGFRLEEKDYLAYNHFDSYPSGLGREIVQQIHQMTIAQLPSAIRTLILVTDETPITPEVIKRCSAYTDLEVSEQSTQDWYCLLREAQGNLLEYLTIGYMPDNRNFIKDSLFCEWGYIINLDTGQLEVWRGFQKLPDATNRYGQGVDGGYYPCRLVAEFDLSTVTEDDVTLLDN